MPFFNGFPYSDYDQINLDWVIKTCKEALDTANVTKEYVENYFANLDVQEEINNKIDQMADDGELLALMVDTITSVTDAWLADNITNPSNPPLDATLTLVNAAAQSKATGDAIAALQTSLTGILDRDALAVEPMYVLRDDDYTITGSINSSGVLDPTQTDYISTDYIALTGPIRLISGKHTPGLAEYNANQSFIKRTSLNSANDQTVYTLHKDTRYIRAFIKQTWSETAVTVPGTELLARLAGKAATLPLDVEDLTTTLIPTQQVTTYGNTSSSSNYREYTFEYDPAYMYVTPWLPTLNIWYSNGDTPETYQLRRYIPSDQTVTPYVLNDLALAGATGYGRIKMACKYVDFNDFHIWKIRKRPGSMWEGKNAIIIGDSVAKGGYDTIEGVYCKVKNPFAEAACRELHINVLNNLAVGGASFGLYGGDTAHYIYTQVNTMSGTTNNANLFIVRGGGNDFTKNLPIGSAENMVRDATFNTSSPATGAVQSLYGEMWRVFKQLMDDNKYASIVFVTMAHRGVKVGGSFKDDFDAVAVNSLGLHMQDYHDAIKEFCATMGITCCDCWQGTINPRRQTHVAFTWSESLATLPQTIYGTANPFVPAPFWYKDLIHPLEQIHERMAHLLVQSIESTVPLIYAQA